MVVLGLALVLWWWGGVAWAGIVIGWCYIDLTSPKPLSGNGFVEVASFSSQERNETMSLGHGPHGGAHPSLAPFAHSTEIGFKGNTTSCPTVAEHPNFFAIKKTPKYH